MRQASARLLIVRILSSLSGAWAIVSLAEPVRAAELTFESSDACATAEKVETQVEALLGISLDAIENLDFDVDVSRNGAHWRLALETTEAGSGERRRRSVQAATCKEIVDAAALAIAMTVRATTETALDSAPVEYEPVLESDAPLSDKAPMLDRPRGNRTRAAPLRTAAAVLGVAQTGLMPETSPGIEVDVLIGWKRLDVVALGAFHPAQEAREADGSGAVFRAFGAGLLGCVSGRISGSLFSGCGGAEVGSLWGEGVGVDRPRSGSSLWTAARLDVSVRVPLTPWLGLITRLGGAAPLVRETFILNEVQLIHRPSRVFGRGAIGLVADL